MDELLERHRPGNGTDDEWRGFEWFALWKLLHVEERSVPQPVWFTGVCLTPDGKTILIAREDIIEMWETATGRFAGVFAKIEESVSKLLLSRDGKKVVAVGFVGPTRVWDVVSKRLLAEIPFSKNSVEQRELKERHIALSPDGKRLAVRYNAAPIEEWGTETGQLIKTYPLPSSLTFPFNGPALYAPSGRLICLALNGRHWELWDVAARQSIAKLDPHSDDPKALIAFNPIGHLFSHDGARYYLATTDFVVRSWEVNRVYSFSAFKCQ